MNRWALLLLMVSLLACGRESSAAERACKSIDRQLECVRCSTAPGCCQEAYCRKPLPWLPCLSLCGLADCYCRKPLPCIPCPAPTGCGSDYCRKPLPELCVP